MEPITRQEIFLASAAGESAQDLKPITRLEHFLKNVADHVKSIGGGGGGGTSIDVTAQVGQTIVVKEVDANGKPTEWEAADFPEGGGAKLIIDYTTEEETLNSTLSYIDFTTDLNGEPFSLKNVLIRIIGTVINTTDTDSQIRVNFGGEFVHCYCQPLNAPVPIYVLASVGNGVVGVQYADAFKIYTMSKTLQHQGEAITKIGVGGNNYNKTHLAAGANIKIWGW